MDIVNFDYLINADRILLYKDVNLQEDYIILGKHDPRRREFKATDYPVWAIPASEVFGYNEIQDESVPLPHRQIMDFQGAGVTAVDDPINKKTIITIPGGGVTPGPAIITLDPLVLNHTITTNARYTIVNFSGPLNGSYAFGAVTTTAQIGDVLVFMTTSDILALSVDLLFNVTKYYLWCGTSVSVVDITGQERRAIHFVFDGTKWVSTYDNC